MNPWLLVWAIISAIAAILTLYDKLIAGKGIRRVPEQTLFLTAILGGALAMYLVMLVIRHKTKHKRFMLGLPLIIAVQAILYCVLA